MKVLMCIMSPRCIPEVIEAYDKIDYIDKYWIKNHTEREALGEVERFFKEHTEYTHLVLTGDDTVPNYNVVAQLIADFNAHPEIEIISATIGLDYFADDNNLSLTIEPVVKEENTMNLSYTAYKRIPYEFVSEGLIRVWYQGFAFTMMTRRVLELIGLKTWQNNKSECMSDLKFSFDCWEAKIPQYADLRTFMWHRHHEEPIINPYYQVKNVFSGDILHKSTKFIPATVSIPKENPVKILSEEDLKIPMLIYNLQNGKHDTSLQICLVTEVSQDLFPWYDALRRFSEKNDWLFVSHVQMSQENLRNKPTEYWNPIREADAVFCYVTCRDIVDLSGNFREWWNDIPKKCREFMHLNAKLIVQYDDDLRWVKDIEIRSWNLGWEKNRGYMKYLKEKTKDPSKFYSETFDIADIYFTVGENLPWEQYCKKPIFHLQLPHLSAYSLKDDYWAFWKYHVHHPSFLGRSCVAIIHHSFIKSDYEHSLSHLKRPITIFTCRPSLPLNDYMYCLSKCAVGLDDNKFYDGWSRFALECALSCVPCVGSTPAVKEFFPDLYTAPQDYDKQNKLIERLFADTIFCKEMGLRGYKRALYKLDAERLCVQFLKILFLNISVSSGSPSLETIQKKEKEIQESIALRKWQAEHVYTESMRKRYKPDEHQARPHP